MTLLSALMAPISAVFQPLTDLLDQRNLYSLLGATLFVFLSAVAVRLKRKPGRMRLKAFFRLLVARRVWLHASSRLDYKLFAVNSALLTFVISVFIVGSGFWVGLLGPVLTTVFGPAPTGGTPGWGVFGFITLCQLLAFDFGYWLANYGFHKSELLWEFHKAHHSAEVMTPATEFRQHPVELVAFPIVFGLTTGLTYAAMVQIFGTEAHKWGLSGQNLILIVHMITFHPLRHSHVELPFTGILGKVFHSPAHHQIHHSADPEHFDRNLGYLLSVWDWMAGTLHMPRKGQKITLGIGHEGKAHDSLSSTM
jgi:sterol desaturase/sphingolipid hydroxylase (fatty acid hydroxylase superfamily)